MLLPSRRNSSCFDNGGSLDTDLKQTLLFSRFHFTPFKCNFFGYCLFYFFSFSTQQSEPFTKLLSRCSAADGEYQRWVPWYLGHLHAKQILLIEEIFDINVLNALLTLWDPFTGPSLLCGQTPKRKHSWRSSFLSAYPGKCFLLP